MINHGMPRYNTLRLYDMLSYHSSDDFILTLFGYMLLLPLI